MPPAVSIMFSSSNLIRCPKYVGLALNETFNEMHNESWVGNNLFAYYRQYGCLRGDKNGSNRIGI